MRMELNRNPDLLARPLAQPVSRVRLAKPGHVFDGEKMSAELFQALRHLDVILQRILRTARIENIAGVTDGRLAECGIRLDRKSTRLNSSHGYTSSAVF